MLFFFWAIFRGNGAKNSYISDPQIVWTLFYFWPKVDPTTLDPPPSLRESGTFFRKCGGVRVLVTPTSKCSNFATTGSYWGRFHSHNNADQYFTNLSQILKFHVDFRVICRHQQDNTSSISETVELCGGSENRNDSLQFSCETREKSILKIRKLDLNWISGTSYFNHLPFHEYLTKT